MMFNGKFDVLTLLLAGLTTIDGCFSTGCTGSFRQASLQQQVQSFKDTTSHIVDLARRTDAAYYAEFQYDGQDSEVYLKQSAGMRIPIKLKLGVFGNAKSSPSVQNELDGVKSGFGRDAGMRESEGTVGGGTSPGSGDSNPFANAPSKPTG